MMIKQHCNGKVEKVIDRLEYDKKSGTLMLEAEIDFHQPQPPQLIDPSNPETIQEVEEKPERSNGNSWVEEAHTSRAPEKQPSKGTEPASKKNDSHPSEEKKL